MPPAPKALEMSVKLIDAQAGERNGRRSSSVQSDGYRAGMLHEVDKAQFYDRLQHWTASPGRGGK